MSATVLVTGGAGYIGSVLVPRLLERGYRVKVLDRLFWGRRPLAAVADDVEIIHGDVRELQPAWLESVDAVVHLAALSNDPTAEYDPEANWEINALGTEKLAEACKRAGVHRFTFGSSCSLYDGLPTGIDYDENAPIRPVGAYARSKHYAEQRLRALADADFCPVILRQATVFGFSPRMRYDLVVNTFVKDALMKGRLFLHGGGWMWRPLVDVTDAAEAHILCLEAPEEVVRGQTFNVMQENYQIRALAMLVAGTLRLDDRDVRLEEAPLPKLVRDYRCMNQKMRDVLGYTPSTTVLASIAHMISGIYQNGYVEFDHPQYYNIRWMELLAEVHSTLRPFDYVLRPGR